MVTIEINLKRLEGLVGKSREDILNALEDLAWEIREIDNLGRAVLERDPDRIDQLSFFSIARALQCYFSGEPKEYKIEEVGGELIVKEVPYRPYAIGLIVKDVSLDEEILNYLIQFQEKVHDTFGRKRRKLSMGYYDLDKIRFPLQYSLEDPNQIVYTPLGWDKKAPAPEIIANHETGKKYGEIIRKYEKWPVLRDAEGKVLALIPIVNSRECGEVSEGTKNLYIDVTGTDFELINTVGSILACDFLDFGAKVELVRVKELEREFNSPILEYKEMEIEYEKINKIIGKDWSREEIKMLLQKSGHLVRENKVYVPSYRNDIRDYRDLAEDCARVFGYRNLIPKLPKRYSLAKLSFRTRVIEEIRILLASYGLVEVMTPALLPSPVQIDLMKFSAPVVKVLESKERYIDSMRRWMLPSLLNYVKANKGEKLPIRIFDIDYVVIPPNNSELTLGVLLYGEGQDYTKIRQVLEYLLQKLRKRVIIKEKDYPWFIEGRSASILFHGEEVGFMGEIHPEVILNFGLDRPASALELSIERLYHFA